MDGLECNEISLSKIIEWNPTWRIDAEFFNKRAIRTDKNLRDHKYFHLKKKEVVSGPFGSSLKSEDYLLSGDIPFVRIENIRGGFCISRNNIVYINKHNNSRIRNSELHTDDLILSKVGNTIGFFARVDNELSPCNISENNIGIKLSVYHPHLRRYILTYLNTKYAQVLVRRRVSGNAQPKLNVGDVCLIPIPEYSDKFNTLISNLIDKNEYLLSLSNSKLSNSNTILISEINISTITQGTLVVAKKSLSDSLGKSGRLDAEYYQPIYDIINSRLQNVVSVKDVCRLHDKTFMPKSDAYYKYIELSDVENNGFIQIVDETQGELLPTRARRLVKSGQVLISTVEGSLNSCAIVTDEYDNALCSTGFFVIDSDQINPETLLILFQSYPIQALMKQRCSGTILSAISKDDFLSMPIPLISPETQDLISKTVQESFALRREAQRLLGVAIRAVEIAIETNEEQAIDYIHADSDV